jgi:hypothetical protein
MAEVLNSPLFCGPVAGTIGFALATRWRQGVAFLRPLS